MFLPNRRWKHFAAMVLIGDGVMALIHPGRDAGAWSAGPRPWRMLMQRMSAHPTITRFVGTAQIAAGIYWALMQEDKPATDTSAAE